MQTIYMNNAAGGWPKAPRVTDVIQQTLLDMPFHPGRSVESRHDVQQECRELTAGILGCTDPQRIVLTSSATLALNLAVLGLDLKQQDHVVTTVAEHNSLLRPLYHQRDRAGFGLHFLRPDLKATDEGKPLAAGVIENARLVACSHVSNVTGEILDVRDLFAQARQAGAVTLLDAAQSFGRIPVDPAELNADIVVLTGHKGLHGPQGAAMMWISPEVQLSQTIVGGTGVLSESKNHPGQMPMRHEAGTPDTTALAGLRAALQWLEGDAKEIYSRENRLNRYLRQALAGIPGIVIHGPASGQPSVGIVSVSINDWSVEEAAYVLARSFGVVCRSGLHCAPLIHEFLGCTPEGTLRLSLSSFTTEEEVDYVTNALASLGK